MVQIVRMREQDAQQQPWRFIMNPEIQIVFLFEHKNSLNAHAT